MPRNFAFLHRFEAKVARRAAAPADGATARDAQAEPDFATLVADVARSQAATEAAQVEAAPTEAESPSPSAGVVDALIAVLAPVAGEEAPSGSFNRAAARRVPTQPPPAATRPQVHGLAPIRTLAASHWEPS